MDNNTDEEIKKSLKACCKPVDASPGFKEQLLGHLKQEAASRARTPHVSVWRRPALWASVSAAVALALIGCFMWPSPASPPIVSPPESTTTTTVTSPTSTGTTTLTSIGTTTLTTTTVSGPTSGLTTTLTSSGTTTLTSITTTTPTSPGTTTTKPPILVSVGFLEIRVIDAPPRPEVTAVVVTVSSIEVHRASDGDWISIEITGPRTFDLIELREGGLEELLASQEITTGKYTQIRMTVEKVEVGIEGGEPQEAKLPSGELKFVQPFNVVEGQTTVLLLDFDADKSVGFTGDGEVIVSPVVTLTVTQPVPPLSVEITSPEDGAELTESTVTVSGTVSDPAAAVTVNSASVTVAADGSFSTEVTLVEGENIITAAAVLGGQNASDSVTVTYTPPPPALVSIAVEPASPDNLAVGATLQFTATGTYSDGSTADITLQVTWASSDEAVATIDATGLATGVAVGSTNITASLSGIDSPAAALTVVEVESG